MGPLASRRTRLAQSTPQNKVPSVKDMKVSIRTRPPFHGELDRLRRPGKDSTRIAR